MTDTPGLARSSQSVICLGLPLRTRNTMVEVYGALLLGKRVAQSADEISPALRMASTSYHRARVTTSASRPSMIERAWAPDPPWDCLMVTLWPERSCQYFAKAVL